MTAILVFGAVFFVLAIVGLVKENQIRADYSGVFGRIRAYFFAGGIIMLPGVIIMSLSGMLEGNTLTGIGAAVAWLVVALAIFLMTKKSCPEHIQKGLFFSMLLAGLGITLKVCLFYLPFVWKIGPPSGGSGGAMPGSARDANGNACHIRQNPNGEYYIRRADGSDSPVRRADASHQLIDSDGNYYSI